MAKKRSRRPSRETSNCLVTALGPEQGEYCLVDRHDKEFKGLREFFDLLASGVRLRLDGDWWRVAMYLRALNHPRGKVLTHGKGETIWVQIGSKKLTTVIKTLNHFDRAPTRNGVKTRSEKPTNVKTAVMYYSLSKEESDELPRSLKKLKSVTFKNLTQEQIDNLRRLVQYELTGEEEQSHGKVNEGARDRSQR